MARRVVIVGFPGDPVDTVILPGGAGVDAARSEPALIDWVKAVSGTARRVVTVCTGAFLAAEAGLLGRTPSDDALGLCRTFRPRISGRSGRCRPDLHAQFAEGVDRGWSHRRHRPRAGTGRRRPRHRDAQTVARWLVLYLRRPGGQTQFAAPVWMPRAKRTSIRRVQEAIEAEPGARTASANWLNVRP